MSNRTARIGLFVCIIILQLSVSFLVLQGMSASASAAPTLPATLESRDADASTLASLELAMPTLLQSVEAPGGADLGSSPEVSPTTTLTVSIINTQRALYGDSPTKETPQVLLVHAVVTNTGTTTATWPQLSLDFGDDPTTGWVVMPGEYPTRTAPHDLARGETFHGYWFARYPTTTLSAHTFTVTADARNASPVSTSDNYFGNPGGGDDTIVTQAAQNTGSTGQIQASAEVVVGVAFTVSVDYALGQTPESLVFSPVGNPAFDASAYQLLHSQVRFWDTTGTQEITYTDRLYFVDPPAFIANAQVMYTFISVKQSDTSICPYAGVQDTPNTWKYDKDFCTGGAVLPITGTISVSLTKQVDVPPVETVQQGQQLTYTVRMTNTGDYDLQYGWVWDQADPSLGRILSAPGIDASASSTSTGLAAWYLPSIESYYARTFTLTYLLDGPNGDIPDGTALVNAAYFGIRPGELPPEPALISAVTRTVAAPWIEVDKDDGWAIANPGDALTYTLRVTNSGSITASNLAITDRLPTGVTYVPGSASIPEDPGGAEVLVWSGAIGGALGPGEQLVIDIPVTVDPQAQDGDVLTNSVQVRYTNDLGWPFERSDEDVTTVIAEGFIGGYAFEDLDGDGRRDGGEPGIPGVTVTLVGPIDRTQVTTTLPVSGYYRFRITAQQPVTLSAALPAGYFRTTPGTVYTDTALWSTQSIDFGYAPISSTFGVVYGTVYEDADHDRQRESGEPVLPGVTITSTWAQTSPLTTNALGQYTFRYDISGTVATIVETNPPFYVSTTPDLIETYVITGSSNGSPFDFGDFAGIVVAGRVFSDTNVSGSDDGEPGIPGVQIDAAGQVTTTDHAGSYLFYVALSASRTITIAETDLPGFVSTAAIGRPSDLVRPVDANTLRIAAPVSGTIYHGDFGDVWASGVITVSGYVWEDQNANGADDDGLRLAGAVVGLSSGLTQTTGHTGEFMLYAPAGGPITVTEVNPIDYVSTNAIPGSNAAKIDNDTLLIGAMSAGQTSALNRFGDARSEGTAVIAGVVFDDEDENGMRAPGEPGLPGITVTLEISGVVGPIFVQTDAAGRYAFAVAPGSDVRITSSRPGGYYPTTLERLLLSAPAPGVYPDNDFGYSDDMDVAVIQGIVFDDRNGDGDQDLGEPGLADAVVTLSDTLSITTTGNGLITGTFRFTVSHTGIYPVAERNPPGYRSTTPDHLNVGVSALGSSYLVAFGDTNRSDFASIYGVVFDDQDGDGYQDATEGGLDGVAISVTVQHGSDVMTTATGMHGAYTFVLGAGEQGYHTVEEQDPARYGYRSTTPDRVNLLVAMGNSYEVSFGDTMSGVFSTIMGTVYQDDDIDGIQDGDELGIAGVQVALSSGATTMTDQHGTYVLFVAEVGALDVIEHDPAGYRSTTPNTVTVQVDSLGRTYVVDFGDTQRTDVLPVYGTVFDDRNVNAARDAAELGLAGVTVTVSGTFDAPPPPYVTNGWGQYTFAITRTGTYTVAEYDLPGYVSTNAIPGSPSVAKVDNNTLSVLAADLGASLGDNLFADVRAGDVVTISGAVWDDNGVPGGTANDGQRTGGELPLPGAVVRASTGMAHTTQADGGFVLYAPPGQDVIVTETNPPGYVSTNALPGTGASKVDDDSLLVSALVAGGVCPGNLFGDVLPADLSIAKSASPDTALAGAVLTYTLSYANDGPSYAQQVVLTDVLPSAVSFGGVVSQPPSWGSPPAYSAATNTLTWTALSLDTGSWGVIVFTGTLDASASGAIVNRAAIASNMPDLVSGNDSATAETQIETEADLMLEKGGPASVVAGTQVTYTLAVWNEGPSDAQGVVLRDTLPG
ncbi:MAG: DUF11 domain-containing protein, partial [Anaerolineae bacterium]|nr:DUF11 domain-containing protein [Anaerolineae bacterium]